MKTLGAILLFLGVVLGGFGFTQMNSVEARLGSLLGNSDPTGIIMVFGGIILGVIGIILLLKSKKK